MKIISIQLNSKKYIKIVFLCYFVVLLTVNFWGISIFSPRFTDPINTSFNVIPFKTISTYLLNYDHYNFSTWFYNAFGLVLLFIPFGLLIPLVFVDVKRVTQIVYLTFITSFSIEVVQRITMLGILDADDVILNLLGSIIGFSTAFLIKKKRKKHS
jgi:glycopeptide antibiotics resistance protein